MVRTPGLVMKAAHAVIVIPGWLDRGRQPSLAIKNAIFWTRRDTPCLLASLTCKVCRPRDTHRLLAGLLAAFAQPFVGRLGALAWLLTAQSFVSQSSGDPA